MNKAPQYILAGLAAGLFCSSAASAADEPPVAPVGPTIVTLHVSGVPLPDAIKQLSKLVQMPIDCANVGEGEPVTINADKQPFLNVLADACDQAHASFDRGFNGAPTIVVQSNRPASGQRVFSGPVLMQFQQVEHVNLLTAPENRRDRCTIVGSVVWEPRLDLVFRESVLIPALAEDENHLSLLPASALPNQPNNSSAFGNYEVQRAQYGNGRFELRLNDPPAAGRRIAHLQGVMRLWIAGKTESLEIKSVKTALRAAGTHSFGALGTLKTEGGQVSSQSIQVQLVIKRNAGELEEAWSRRKALLYSMHSRALDSDGHLWGQSTESNGYGWGGNEFNISVNIERSSGVTSVPDELIIEGATQANELDAAYELKDLPLP